MKKTVRVIAAALIGTVCIFGAQSAAYAASAAKTDAAGVATATTSANAAPAAAAKSTSGATIIGHIPVVFKIPYIVFSIFNTFLTPQ